MHCLAYCLISSWRKSPGKSKWGVQWVSDGRDQISDTCISRRHSARKCDWTRPGAECTSSRSEQTSRKLNRWTLAGQHTNKNISQSTKRNKLNTFGELVCVAEENLFLLNRIFNKRNTCCRLEMSLCAQRNSKAISRICSPVILLFTMFDANPEETEKHLERKVTRAYPRSRCMEEFKECWDMWTESNIIQRWPATWARQTTTRTILYCPAYTYLWAGPGWTMWGKTRKPWVPTWTEASTDSVLSTGLVTLFHLVSRVMLLLLFWVLIMGGKSLETYPRIPRVLLPGHILTERNTLLQNKWFG